MFSIFYLSNLKEKLSESLAAVLPIIGIVLILCFTIAPISTGILLSFLLGAAFLIVGMMFFSLGAELAMTPVGERIGVAMTKSKRLVLMMVFGFLLGFIITVSEPDLQVLAEQVPSVPNIVLILAVATGVGLFLCVALLRMLFSIALPPLLVGFYALTFALALFVPEEFLAVSFDSGGVTTGPMTVPFIMALGVGISQIRTDRHATDDSFGLVALCSIGPILATLLLGTFYKPDSMEESLRAPLSPADSASLFDGFLHELPDFMKEIAISLLPIIVVIFLFQLFVLKLERRAFQKILVGLAYTYVGLVLFLTGVNVGFMPAGTYLGTVLAALPYQFVIIPIGMLIGFFIVKAEPAVAVLKHQVEELTDGAVSAAALEYSLSIGVSVSVGLAMLRALTGISFFWLLVPGYATALALSFFVPKLFTAIAFDSGGVASGPMTATFLLPLAKGVCDAVGGNIVRDAFGVVAMVAMTPLITIQVLGLWYRYKTRAASESVPAQGAGVLAAGTEGDAEIVLF